MYCTKGRFLYHSIEFLFIIDENGNKCLTTNEKVSPQRKRPCVFPWIDPWTNKKNEGCAAPDGDEYGVWCPTKVNDDMKYIDGEGNWGYCNEKCLINSN